jgi:radical SAM enzyme (TIGR01210 family)
MDQDAAGEIAAGTAIGRKTYPFDEAHDRRLPAQMWFQQAEEGLVLFLVLYTQACRWSRCLGCNLPSKGSQFPVTYKALVAQIDHVFADPQVVRQKDAIRKVILSNNGSVLDQDTFSTMALMYFVVQMNLLLPNVAVLSVETRPEYVELAELEVLRRGLEEGDTPTALELAIGFEAFDDSVRNQVFHKGIALRTIESLVRKIARVNRRARYGYRLKCYFMQKPIPGMRDDEAVEDVRRGIEYLSGLARRHKVRINLHLNPTFVAAGTPLEESFRRGLYSPPRLLDVARAALHADGKAISLFIGLYDEGMAVEGGSFVRDGDGRILERLEAFNRTQDFAILRALRPPGPA